MNPVLCMSGDAGIARIGVPSAAWRTANSTADSGSSSPRKRSRNHRQFPALRPMLMSTPFGSPVVPPVYDRNTSSSSRAMRGAGAAPEISSS